MWERRPPAFSLPTADHCIAAVMGGGLATFWSAAPQEDETREGLGSKHQAGAGTIPGSCLQGGGKVFPTEPLTCRPVPALVPVVFACDVVLAVLPPLLTVLFAEWHMENPLPTPAAVNLQGNRTIHTGGGPRKIRSRICRTFL